MQTLKLRLVVAGVPMAIEAYVHWSTTTSFGRRHLDGVSIKSVRVTKQHADVLDLLVGDTLRFLEDAAKRWALTRDRLDHLAETEEQVDRHPGASRWFREVEHV